MDRSGFTRLLGVLAFFVAAQLFRWEPESKIPRNAKLWAAATALPFVLLGIWENHQGTLLLQSQSAYFQLEHPENTTSPPRDIARRLPPTTPKTNQKSHSDQLLIALAPPRNSAPCRIATACIRVRAQHAAPQLARASTLRRSVFLPRFIRRPAQHKHVIPTEASPRLFFAFASERTRGLAKWRDPGVINT